MTLRTRKELTGRQVFGIFVLFFGTVIGVNVLMATQATRTFGGTVVDNSYVASQHFNRWLAEANREKRLGWSVMVDRAPPHALVRLSGSHGALDGATLRATAIHPLGRLPSMELRFEALGHGRYRSVEALPAGRWRLELEVRRDGRDAHFVDEVPA
jgi:nitrogen fixation protein FixH